MTLPEAAVRRRAEVSGYGSIIVEKDVVDSDVVVLRLDDLTADDDEVQMWGEEADGLVDTIREVQNATRPDTSARVEVSPVEPVFIPLNAREELIQAFISQEIALRIHYVDLSGQETTRTVSPYEIRNRGKVYPYLVAYSHGSEGEHYASDPGIRNFRIANITGLAPATERYRPESS